MNVEFTLLLILNNREYYCCEDRYINNLGSIAPYSIFVHIEIQLRLSLLKLLGSKIENLIPIVNCSELSISKCIRYSLFNLTAEIKN